MAELFWTVPTRADGRGRRGDFDHFVQVARAAEAGGFDGLVVPHDPDGEDSWILAAALAQEAPRLIVVAQFSPAFGTAVYGAKMSATFQRFSGGRLGWQVLVDEEPATARAHGDVVDDPDRYTRAAELLTIARGVWNQNPFTYQGRFFEVVDGGLDEPLDRHPFPRVFLAGSSDEALGLSATHGDVHLFDTTDVVRLRSLVGALRQRASAEGRVVTAGVRCSVITRDDEDEARLHQRRHGTGRPGAALVGSHQQVAEQLRALLAAGPEVIVLSGEPNLEEAYLVGEQLLPRLQPASTNV